MRGSHPPRYTSGCVDLVGAQGFGEAVATFAVAVRVQDGAAVDEHSPIRKYRGAEVGAAGVGHLSGERPESGRGIPHFAEVWVEAVRIEAADHENPPVGQQDLVPRSDGAVIVQAGRGLPGSRTRVVDLRGG